MTFAIGAGIGCWLGAALCVALFKWTSCPQMADHAYFNGLIGLLWLIIGLSA